jgi:hypothetical protein
MDKMIPHKLRQATLGTAVIAGIAVVLVLMLYGVLSYPVSLSQSGLLNLFASVGALLTYAGAALWVRQKSIESVQLALAQGAKIGIFLGVIAVINLSLEHFVASSAPLSAVRGVSMWGVMFLSFGAAGSAAYRKVGSLGLAVMSSIWSSLVSTVSMLIFGFFLALVFMPHMVLILAPAYAESGMTDAQAFVIQHTLNASTMHLLLVPIVAGIFGLMGGCAASILRSISQSVSVSLGVFELLLFIAGITSLRFASSLDRPARPPFVMAGLLALGIALACAHPILTVIRRRATTE